MELKLFYRIYTGNCYILLIVPYGIETSFVSLCQAASNELLIVPYGIETYETHKSLISFLNF